MSCGKWLPASVKSILFARC